MRRYSLDIHTYPKCTVTLSVDPGYTQCKHKLKYIGMPSLGCASTALLHLDATRLRCIELHCVFDAKAVPCIHIVLDFDASARLCIPCISYTHGWTYVWFCSPIRAEHFKAPVEGHHTYVHRTFFLSNRIPGISLTVAISDLCVAACNNNEKKPWQSRDATSRADAQEGRLPAGERRGGACGA